FFVTKMVKVMITRILCALFFCSAPLAAFEGFYLGGSIGAHLGEATQSGANTAFQEALFQRQPLQKTLFDHNIAGMVYGGYGYRCNSLYLALEGVAQFSHSRFNSNQIFVDDSPINSAKVSAQVKTVQCGIDFLPGWQLNPNLLLYGRVGAGAARISAHANS